MWYVADEAFLCSDLNLHHIKSVCRHLTCTVKTSVSVSLCVCDFQLREIELEIQRKKEALKEDDRRRRNLVRQVC